MDGWMHERTTEPTNDRPTERMNEMVCLQNAQFVYLAAEVFRLGQTQTEHTRESILQSTYCVACVYNC